MKVLFITPYYYPNVLGGSERSVKMLAEGLVKKGVDVNVLSFDGKNKNSRQEIIENVKVIRKRLIKIKPNTLAQNLSLLLNHRAVRDINPDIIHVYNTWHIPSAYFFKNKKTKVVATLNNYFPVCPISYTKNNLMEREKFTLASMYLSIRETFGKENIKNTFLAIPYTLYWKAVYYPSKRLDCFIPISRTTGKIYALQGFNKNKIRPVYNLFDKEFTKVEKRTRLKNYVIYVGGLLDSKGVLDLVEAFKYVKNKEIKLFLIGGGNLFDKINSMKKDISKNIFLLGKLDHKQLKEYYLKCSFTVHPSLWPDPFPRVLLEILKYNVPVLAADNPVAKEVLGNSAVFYERGNLKDLARKIDLMAAGKLKSDVQQARKRIFSFNPINEIYGIYQDLLKK